ncbi:MAG: iron-containing alcohol dehydrogenase [Bacillota bacterium]
MNNFEFYNPTKIMFGKGQVEKVGKKVSEYGKNVLLTYGGGSIKRFGLYDKVISLLEKENLNIFELGGIESNPRLSSVKEGIKICKKNNIDFILAVGGGSTIDASKAISVGYYHNGDLWKMIENDGKFEKGLPLGTILTLAATGSEMNANAVITNWDKKEKKAIHGSKYPDFSILDPENTYTVPRNYTVFGIIDIAAHVFEQYFSHTEATYLVDSWAEDILKNLIKKSSVVLSNPEDYDARADIMLAGTMALNGLIGMGKEQDWASHAIEHAVSAVYDIPHGAGLSIIFPNWMKYVLDEGEDKFVQYGIKVFDIDPAVKTDKEIALEAISETRNWFNEMDAPATLSYYEISRDDLELMAEKAVENGEIGNYKKLGKKDVLEILKMSFE